MLFRPPPCTNAVIMHEISTLDPENIWNYSPGPGDLEEAGGLGGCVRPRRITLREVEVKEERAWERGSTASLV